MNAVPPLSPKQDRVYTKIAGEAVSVAVTFLSESDDYLGLHVDTRDAAFIAAYAYRSFYSRIDRAASSGFLVVVYKKHETRPEVSKLITAADAALQQQQVELPGWLTEQFSEALAGFSPLTDRVKRAGEVHQGNAR